MAALEAWAKRWGIAASIGTLLAITVAAILEFGDAVGDMNAQLDELQGDSRTMVESFVRHLEHHADRQCGPVTP